MSDECRNLVETEMTRILEKLQTLTPGTKEYAAVEASYFKFAQIINEDKKARAEVTRICTEMDRVNSQSKYDTRKLDLEEQRLAMEKSKAESDGAMEFERLKLDEKRIRVEEQKVEVDEKRVKAAKTDTIVGAVTKGLLFGCCLVQTAMSVNAEWTGEFISKTGLGTIFKPKL